MSAINRAFEPIHPRTSASVRAYYLPKWLENARNLRTMKGYYASSAENFLIPKGPLLRLPREENQACANYIPDLFSYLSVVPQRTKENNRDIFISIKTICSDDIDGVSGPAEIGAEEILFVPVAEKVGELDLRVESAFAGGTKFYNTRLAPDVVPSDRILGVLKQEPNADILSAPELVIDEENADALVHALKKEGRKLTKLLLAGSGSTRDVDDNNMAWNEARVFNGIGELLWSQRKIWPAGLKPGHVEQYGIEDPAQSLTLEKNASGNSMTVADLDGFGRCVVLICQDVQAMPLSFDIVSHFQPDWVFVPILDQGATYNGWAHQRVFELSAHSQSRFLISCSRALKSRKSADELGHGLAVGPKSALDPDDISRACNLVKAVSPESPSFGKMNWKKSDWIRSKFTSS